MHNRFHAEFDLCVAGKKDKQYSQNRQACHYIATCIIIIIFNNQYTHTILLIEIYAVQVLKSLFYVWCPICPMH